MVNWGIVGAGGISSRFVADLKVLIANPAGPNKIKHTIGAVASTQIEKAEKFINEFIGDGYGTKAVGYDEVINDPSIDVLYIGLPHTLHAPFVVRAIEEGKKNILCEKPITINARELEDILAAAKKHNVFFMEAMWSRYFPTFLELQKKLYDDKVIGDIKKVQCTFNTDSKEFPITPEHRAANKKLGGGALLDIGIYPITYARTFLDPSADPTKDWSISSELIMESLTGNKADEVDFVASAIFNDKTRKQQASISASFHTESDGNIVSIEGTLGRAYVKAIGDTPSPQGYKIVLKDGSVIEKDFFADLNGGEGFWYEAVEVGEVLAKGGKQSELMSWDESRKIMWVLDTIRKQNDFFYEQDQ
ncbi:NAD(P)-binding protein [Suhomyces tanzawaensis NRRL Y-17324]|uniref:D-xylose 1-dehydrogenase (NADP(+), D-xylono-1,5-lactone-forming) n=1 Tax=Suhomyces tanzawaensis NRRL Y-17324 TaxID=984487 RepID=A0A1E4SET4_9ASCO|nr:NAD(P)-binding protein [Suhomyces tanzawaensis NRRL Y-17324]ODV77990.1 NAD(P)-binding protein [Suhomyces tanzawaensis NRRL Y-17324]